MTWKAERLTQFDIPERKVQEHITTNAKQLLNEEQERLIQVREELINMFEGLSPEFQDRAIALWEKAIFMRVDQIQQQLTEGLSDMLEGIAAEQIAELQNAVVEAR
jgi:hypothetical protein